MNKIAIITGASGTLGLKLTKIYLENDYFVYAIYNSKKIDIKNTNLKKYKYNLKIEKEFSELCNDLNNIINEKTSISIIHTAGIYTKSNIEDFNLQSCNNLLNINTFSFLNLYSNLFNLIINSSICNILLISSNLVKRLNKGSLYYCLSKSMNDQIVKHIAYEHGKYNILANSLQPGMFISNMNKETTNEKIETIKNNIPLKKMLSVDELAKFIYDFTTCNTFINGEVITMDGGNTLGY